MNQSIDHKDRVSRINLERQKYVRDRLSAELAAVNADFSGQICIEIPVVRGSIGRIKVTRTDQQIE